ncbi:MAG: hypothetical protein DRQ37_03590 [Gammaproteobacteria bacterium]|nr:MAG: hypothetical protein DRQ37_03590 [Gammaproteobacteria bacterium]
MSSVAVRTVAAPAAGVGFNYPPMLLGAAVLLWGWHTGALLYAVPMALVLEGARWFPWSLALSDRDFERLSDGTTLLMLVLVVYQFDQHGVRGVFPVLRWMPTVVLVLVLGQVFTTRKNIKLSALFLSVRRAERRGQLEQVPVLDIRHPFFVLCLVSASAGELRSPAFFPLLIVLLAWAFWPIRPRRYPVILWLLAMLAVGGGGYVASKGLIELRRAVEPVLMEWALEYFRHRRDPFRSHTAIGEIGKLKLSDRIVMRVRPQNTLSHPSLLRQASYRRFSNNIWLAGAAKFEELTPEGGGTRWILQDVRGTPERRVGISTYLIRGKGILGVPNGTHEIRDLNVEELHRNPLGALKAVEGPDLVEFTAVYDPARSVDGTPQEAELAMPQEYREVIHQVADELSLGGLPPLSVVQRLHDYFIDGFQYSLEGATRTRLTLPLVTFLKESRRGHCEYFASATVLLLRAAGIPARYASGYSIQEYSEVEQAYVVRRRHAHSWALAYIDGRWQDVDTTPPGWIELEAADAPWWEGTYDLLSWLWYRFTRWRLTDTAGESNDWILWLVFPLVAVLIWRLYRRGELTRRPSTNRNSRLVGRPQEESGFQLIAARLHAAGYPRREGETLAAWFNRLQQTQGVVGAAEVQASILPLHYRYRFDPAGLGPDEFQRLRRDVESWLAQYPLAKA